MQEIIATGPADDAHDDEGRSAQTLDGESDAPDSVETRAWTVSAAAHGLRLDKLLVGHAGEFSRSHLQGLIERGCVALDGRVQTTAASRVRAGQLVAVRLEPTAESRAYRAEAMTLDIRHEDDHLLVLCKPAGLVVHPAAGHWSGTLLNGLLAHHRGAFELPRAGIVHRLDKDTSGLMVVAKTLQAQTALVRALARREVSRQYVALTHGRPQPAARWIEAPIGRDPVVRTRMAVMAGGRPARTHIEVLGACGGPDPVVAAVRCTLDTGRTHQIRVHLASIGHPLLGDALYGGRPLSGLTRQALHARWLRLVHPVTGIPLAFEAPPAEDFARAWALAGGPERLDGAPGRGPSAS